MFFVIGHSWAYTFLTYTKIVRCCSVGIIKYHLNDHSVLLYLIFHLEYNIWNDTSKCYTIA